MSAANPWRPIPVTIRRVQRETADVQSYDLEFRDTVNAHAFQFLPGQFNMLYVPGVGESAISIATRAGSSLRHTIRTVGAVTSAIKAGGVGMHLALRGPFGVGWPMEQIVQRTDRPDVIVAAGGVGLAPLRYLLESLLTQRKRLGELHLLVGARSADELLYKSELLDWQQRGVAVESTVDRSTAGWTGHVGVVTLLLDRLAVPRPASTFVMTCGPEVMMRYVARSALAHGIPETNVWVTLERSMNCAIGLCGHCQLGPEFLCKDGPVFCYDRVRHWLRIQDL